MFTFVDDADICLLSDGDIQLIKCKERVVSLITEEMSSTEGLINDQFS